MSIAEQITKLQTARNIIREKLASLGLVDSVAKLEACAAAINEIKDNGAVTATVKEGESFTIPAGYHNGSGSVAAVAGGGNYKLQSKSVTPTKSPQSIVPDSGFYGLSSVNVGVIPAEFQDVSSVTAGASDVVAGKIFVDSTGAVTPGTMPDNGDVEGFIDGLTVMEYTIPKGKHSGNGVVRLTNDIEEALAAI